MLENKIEIREAPLVKRVLLISLFCLFLSAGLSSCQTYWEQFDLTHINQHFQTRNPDFLTEIVTGHVYGKDTQIIKINMHEPIPDTVPVLEYSVDTCHWEKYSGIRCLLRSNQYPAVFSSGFYVRKGDPGYHHQCFKHKFPQRVETGEWQEFRFDFSDNYSYSMLWVPLGSQFEPQYTSNVNFLLFRDGDMFPDSTVEVASIELYKKRPRYRFFRK